MYKSFIKPSFDFAIALAGIVLFSPVIIACSLILLISLKGNPFFLQPRPGKGGKIFTLIKFKTMRDIYDSAGKALPDSQRLTTLGKIIRKSSLDELPQLINVLLGQMSIIGPRPLLVEYLALYSQLHARRHEVKPGLTGWAQVNGRNDMKFSTRFEYDVWYIDHLSFCLDLNILLATFKKVFTSSGVQLYQSIEEIDDLGFYKKIK